MPTLLVIIPMICLMEISFSTHCMLTIILLMYGNVSISWLKLIPTPQY